MSSKEGHFRYSTRKKLVNLVGKEISVIECGQDFPSYSGFLVRDNGFYVNGKQIPIRFITPISQMDLSGRQIEVCSDYLTMGNLGRIVADLDIDALTTEARK
jgi:hypothetical protein